jgi:hypothetical protein
MDHFEDWLFESLSRKASEPIADAGPPAPSADELTLRCLIVIATVIAGVTVMIRLFGKPAAPVGPLAAASRVVASFSPWFPLR